MFEPHSKSKDSKLLSEKMSLALIESIVNNLPKLVKNGSTRTPLVNSHPRTLTNSHPDQHVRLPRRGPWQCPWQCWPVLVSGGQTRAWLKSHSPKLSDSLHGRDLFLIFPNPLLKAIPIKYIVDRLKLCSFLF